MGRAAMPLPTNGGAGVGVGILLLLSLFTPRGQSADSTVASLSTLQSESPSGVIRLNDSLLRRILSLPIPRPFHFLIFFDAQKHHSRSELALLTLKSEFSLLSSSFLTNHPKNTSHLFFFDVEVSESQASFALFAVNSVPHIRLIPSTAADLKSDTIKLEASQFSTLADSLRELIDSELKVSVGPFHRPPLLSKTQMMIAVGVAVISVKKVEPILREKSAWMAGAVLVYLFSVSGGMFNIIRKVPMYAVDRRGGGETMMLFYRGAGVQFGLEGLSVGVLYTMVGLLLGVLCHVVVRVRDGKWQRICMIVILVVGFWAVREVALLNNWKTGYHIHAYWPSNH